MKYLITGTGRCGTRTLSVFLTRAGYSCGHESIFRHGGRPKDIPDVVAESSWMAAPYLDDERLKDTTIIHLVREPIRVVSSIIHIGLFTSENVAGYAHFIYLHLPKLKRYNTLNKALYFYIEWNRMIEPYADVFFRLEDGPEALIEKLELDPLEEIHWGRWNQSTVSGAADLSKAPDELLTPFFTMRARYGY